MKINDLEVHFRNHPKLEDHFVLEVENTLKPGPKDKKGKPTKILVERFEVAGNKLKLRLTKETALQLAQFIDKSLDF